MAKQLKITFDGDKTTVEAIGVQGPSCANLLKPYMTLGVETGRTNKPEMYEVDPMQGLASQGEFLQQ